MASSKTFNGVTPEIWECVKTKSNKDHKTVYAPPGAATGTATTDTGVGTLVLNFNFDVSKNSVTYTIEKKPLLVPEGEIWKGIQKTITSCSGK